MLALNWLGYAAAEQFRLFESTACGSTHDRNLALVRSSSRPARAAQRGARGARVKRLGEALYEGGVIGFVKRGIQRTVSAREFEKHHREWCDAILANLRKSPRVTGFGYGRAAKLVAVYIKTAVVLRNPRCQLARVAHPPIDGILLKNIATSKGIAPDLKAQCRKTRWTSIGRSDYYSLIEKLRMTQPGKPLWHLEQHWPGY